jgi:hypothetical protein
MRKLNLAPYQIRAAIDPETGEDVMVPYDVKRSIENVMLASGEMTSQKLNMSELLRRADVARKIADCSEDEILLEEDEFQYVKKGFDAFQGFSINEVELCRRIENAETVEVQEKKSS